MYGLIFEDEKYLTRVNGHRCVLVNACLKAGSNIAETQKKYLPGHRGIYQFLTSEHRADQKYLTRLTMFASRLNGLGEDFLIAIVLVLITLLPLGVRPALIVMVAIPLSLSLGLVGLNYLNISLNQFSIVGLIVALSLLVDDSIVVIENIERWLHEGYSTKETVVLATKQIGMAVLGCTATLIISIFTARFFANGGPGRIYPGIAACHYHVGVSFPAGVADRRSIPCKQITQTKST